MNEEWYATEMQDTHRKAAVTSYIASGSALDGMVDKLCCLVASVIWLLVCKQLRYTTSFGLLDPLSSDYLIYSLEIIISKESIWYASSVQAPSVEMCVVLGTIVVVESLEK